MSPSTVPCTTLLIDLQWSTTEWCARIWLIFLTSSHDDLVLKVIMSQTKCQNHDVSEWCKRALISFGSLVSKNALLYPIIFLLCHVELPLKWLKQHIKRSQSQNRSSLWIQRNQLKAHLEYSRTLWHWAAWHRCLNYAANVHSTSSWPLCIYSLPLLTTYIYLPASPPLVSGSGSLGFHGPE